MNKKNQNIKKNKKIKFYIRITVLVLITVIGCYGIIKAPKSDTDILERELAENERLLQQANRPKADTTEPSDANFTKTESPESARPEPSPVQTGSDASSPIKISGNDAYKTETPKYDSDKNNSAENDSAENDQSSTAKPDTGSSLTPYPDGSSDGKADKNSIKQDKDKTDLPDKSGEDISVIGDSVFLGASPSFKELYKDAVIDAKVSRQVSQGLEIAKELDKNGRLGATVIISLGTNGNFNESTGQELIDYLGTDRTIYWINAYGKKLDIQDDVNRTIKKLADENDNVHVISWAKMAKNHSDWFYQDGIHLNKDGQEGFAKFVSGAINGE